MKLNTDHYLDAIRLWQEYMLYDRSISMLSLMNGYKTVPAQNCDRIEDVLKKHNISVQYVARHSVWGIDYYELVMKKDADRHIFEKDISELFGIPSEWVGFVSCSPKIIVVKEKEFNDKFCDENGLLQLEFDFLKICHSPVKIRHRLDDKGITCRSPVISKTAKGLVYIDCSASANRVAEALNIPYQAVDDVSCDCEFTHVINVYKVKKND